MKKIIVSILLSTIFIYSIMCAVLCAENKAVCDSFVRIHIIANSDEPYDQIIKMGVRNHIFEKFKNEFSAFSSKAETLNYLENNISLITEEVNSYLKKNNYEKRATAYTSYEKFPPKSYNGFALPKGRYNALKIVIGKGKGRNFFCVMYPPLCISENIKLNEALPEKTADKIKSVRSVQYKSAILECVNYILR